MKQIHPALIALSATIPVALLVLWWVYHKRAEHNNEEVKSERTSESKLSMENPQLAASCDSEKPIDKDLKTNSVDNKCEIEEDVLPGRLGDPIQGEASKEEPPNCEESDQNPQLSVDFIENNMVPELQTVEMPLDSQPDYSNKEEEKQEATYEQQESSEMLHSKSDINEVIIYDNCSILTEELSHKLQSSLDTEYSSRDEGSTVQIGNKSVEVHDDNRSENNLVDIAIADSVQMNMSLPMGESEISPEVSNNLDCSPEDASEQVHDLSAQNRSACNFNEDSASGSVNGSSDITSTEEAGISGVEDSKTAGWICNPVTMINSVDESHPVVTGDTSSFSSHGITESSSLEVEKAIEVEVNGMNEISDSSESEETREELESNGIDGSSNGENRYDDTNNETTASMCRSLENESGLDEGGTSTLDENSIEKDSLEDEVIQDPSEDVSNCNNNNNFSEGEMQAGKRSTTGTKARADNEAEAKTDIDENGNAEGEDLPNGNGHADEFTAHQNGKLSLNYNGLTQHPQYNGPLIENQDDDTHLYLEFPSEKVGLLIGKLGRNIKHLKQDSGADITVHTVPFRDDIQVLHIIGSPPAVQYAANKIQHRFRDVPLAEFDASNAMNLHSSPPMISPTGSPVSPPTFAYPIPDMSQLRLPEGIPVEVIVSAIADCDCIFLQQYTHPTYHALASLEQAMSICYAAPSTPALLSPVQVGLVCVAQHQDIWYRAQVINASEDSNEITIKFVDYGGYSTIPTSTVKQIRADFITLPFQAAECYLDNIAPLEGEDSYSLESTTVLQELLKEGEFHSRISRYRPDGHPLILLYKRHLKQTDLVNELLVAKGVARWVEYNPESLTPVVT